MKNQKKQDKSLYNSPLLDRMGALMPEGIRKTISSDPIIPLIAARAKEIILHQSDFIRSDQGQVMGIFPDEEIYYGPSSGLVELRRLVARFWTYAYKLQNKPKIPPTGWTRGMWPLFPERPRD